MHRNVSLALLSMVVLLAGCDTRITDFTVISTKNIDLSQMDTFERGTERVTGKDTVQIIVIFPTKERANVEEAIDNAIESVLGGVALVDGMIYVSSWYIPWIYGETTVTIEGTPLIDPSRVGNEQKAANGKKRPLTGKREHVK